MAYDEAIAESLRRASVRLDLGPDELLGELKMFGGVCISLNRKMLAGTANDKIMIRLGDEDFEQAISVGRATPMDFTGKPMKNFAYVRPNDDDLLEWMKKSLEFVRTKSQGAG